MNTTYSTLLIEKIEESKSMMIKLNRPNVLNAMNLEMIAELCEVFDQIKNNQEIFSVILTGNHPYAFCGGADSSELLNELSQQERQKFIKQMEILFWKMTELPQPIIGIINGYAIGGGSQLAATCDIRVGSYKTSFQFAGATYGLVVASWQLASIIGVSRAKEALITARRIGAVESKEMGLLHYVFDGTELEYQTKKIAKQISQNSLNGITSAKRFCNSAYGSTLEQAYLIEMNHNIENIGSIEFVNGLSKSVQQRRNKSVTK